MDIVDPTIPFRGLLGLLIQLGEDESELLLNLHGDLEAAPGSRLTDTNITILDLGLYLELEYLSGVYSNDGNGRRRPTRAAARRQLPASGNNQDKFNSISSTRFIVTAAWQRYSRCNWAWALLAPFWTGYSCIGFPAPLRS